MGRGWGVSRYSFDLEIERFRQDLLALAEATPMILARSLNRAGVSGQTALVRAVAADTGIAHKNIKREIQLDKATRSLPIVAMTIRGRRIPLIAFGARGPEPSKGRGKGVTYRLPGGRGRVGEAFIATMQSGHRGVFRRKPGFQRSTRHGPPPTRPQLPIMELRGPSLPHVSEKQLAVFQAAAQQSLLKNLQSEISFVRGKAKGDE
jgi:hypothetical protein